MENNIKEAQLQHMHDMIHDMFLQSCKIIVEKDLDDTSFKYCLDTINNTLQYLKERRSYKRESQNGA